MTTSAVDPRIAQLALPMSAYQKVAIGVIVLLCMLDGLDVMAITFAAPAIKALWHIDQSQVGRVLASGLFGMAAGSLLLAPIADLIGRRQTIFLSLAIMIAGTLWTAATQTINELLVSRVFTGLGIGAMVSVIGPMTAEYANTRSRDFCQTVFAIGFPMGGLLGGILAGTLLPAAWC
jgi:MFS transporter, AAHS family, 4-hydroxybenzoate transporter